jgi:hypothetical protein
MSDIAPAEAVLATIGIEPILSREVERFTADKVRSAMGLQKRVWTLARKLAKGTLEPEVEAPELNYNRILRELTTPWDVQQITEMVAAFPPEMSGLMASFLPLASRAVAFMKSQFPVQVRQSVTGVQNVRPPDLAVGRFEVILGVINDPCSVFPLMVNGALLRRQVLAVQAIYPSFAMCVVESLREAITMEKARKQTYALSYAAELGIEKFLGTSTMPTALKQSLQEPPQPAPTPTDKRPSDGVESQRVRAEQNMTTAQRAAVPLHG